MRSSAQLALSATAGDPDAGGLTIIDRALLFELLVAQAAQEGDLDAAEAWRARAEPLAAIPIANSTVSRLAARVELLAGRPAEAARRADLAVAQARMEGRAVEAAEGEVVAAMARVVLSRPGEARQLLEHLVATTDREGHHAVRRSAARLLRTTGQRLRPQPGSEWAGLSPRERDVALLVAAGLGNGEIAEELHVSPHTVRIHISRILAAFGAASRFAVIAHVAAMFPEVAPVRRRMRPLLPRAAIVLTAAVLLTGCAPGAGTSGGSAADVDAGSTGDTAADADAGSAGAAAADCSNVTTAGWELFVDPRLTVEPALDVYPLESGDSIAFTDTPPDDEYTTYSYSTAYIDDGTAFPNRSAIFVGAEDTGTWSLDGPFAVHSVDGGPYFGILQIEATTTAGTTEIARLCIAFAESE